MKQIITVIAVCLAATGVWAKDVDWQKNYTDALVKAKKDKKLVLVDIYTDWCGWCKKLDRDTYSDKDVQAKLAKDFIAVKINPEKNSEGKKLQQEFGARGYPFLAFVNSDGKKIGQVGGYMPAADFLRQLEQISKQAGGK